MPSAFDFFGIKPAYILDEKALQETYYQLSKHLHPDRATRGDRQTLLKNQAATAELNQAYQVLKNPDDRLDLPLTLTGIAPSPENSKQNIPLELAEEYFELQETYMNEPEEAPSKVAAFCGKVTGSTIELDRAIDILAREVDWQTPDAFHEPIKKLIDLKKKRAYLISLIENTRKLTRTFDNTRGTF